MAKADLKVIGPTALWPEYLVSGGTAIQAGEPLHTVGDTHSSGEASVNTAVLAAADTPVIGTHQFRGVANKNSVNVAAGTVAEQQLLSAHPVPYTGRIRGRAETVTSFDTLSELGGLAHDFVLIDYSAAGAADGGELYTIKIAASADTSGLEIVAGNLALSLVDLTIAAQAYRSDVS